MTREHGQNIHHPDHSKDVYPRDPLPRLIPGSPARSRFACGDFHPSSSEATRREKGLAIGSCERSERGGFDSKTGPTARTEVFACCHLPATLQVAARSCPAREGHPRPEIGCSLLG